MSKRWLLGMAWCMAALCSAQAQEGGIVRIDPLAADANPAAEQHAGIFAERDFIADPHKPSVIGNGQWRLQPAAGIDQPLLLVYHPYSARVSVQGPGLAAPVIQTLFDRDLDPQYSRHALVFPLHGDGPVAIKVEGARYPLQVAVVPRTRHIAYDLTQVRILLLAVGVLVGVSLTVLLFWAMLRERVYLLYAATMALQMLFLLCSYGEAYALPGLRALAVFGAPGIWFVATLSTMAAVWMLQDYAGLRLRVPRLSRAMRWVGHLHSRGAAAVAGVAVARAQGMVSEHGQCPVPAHQSAGDRRPVQSLAWGRAACGLHPDRLGSAGVLQHRARHAAEHGHSRRTRGCNTACRWCSPSPRWCWRSDWPTACSPSAANAIPPSSMPNAIG